MESHSEEIQSSPQWISTIKFQELQIDAIQSNLIDFESTVNSTSEISNQELKYLRGKHKIISSILTHLKSISKSKALKEEEEEEEEEKEETLETNEDNETLDLILNSITTISTTIETLTIRAMTAESEVANSKEKVKLGLEEIEKKSLQIELMEARVEEMERFAKGTNTLLREMRERVEEMVGETARQRERALENEMELIRVKRDFESLRSYVGTLVDARESVLRSEKTLQSVDKIFDRIMAKNSQLESEKAQKEIDIQKLIEENVKLRAKLDRKEAQLVAMNEQCKFMALNDPNF